MDSKILQEYCQKLPKIELHAHLNGCVRKSFLKELAIQYGLESDYNQIDSFMKKDIEQAFKIFTIIYKVVFELENIKKIIEQMIEDFQNDNVIYLEIRTTPKEIPSKYTKEQYIVTILNVIKAYEENTSNKMIVRLLLCIDRGQTLESAENFLSLLKKYKGNQHYSKYLIGVDFCGNPYKQKFSIFKNIFEEIRQIGLKITLHVGELPGESYLQETQEILNFIPDRIGHFNYFNEELFQQLIKLKIPIEMCPTSNLFTLKLENYSKHHFKEFFQSQHPISLCTDGIFFLIQNIFFFFLDTCVFDTNLSNEIFQMAVAFKLSKQQIKQLILDSIEYIFDESVKQQLKNIIQNYE